MAKLNTDSEALTTTPDDSILNCSLAKLYPTYKMRLRAPQRRIPTGWPELDNFLTPPNCKQGGFVYPSLNLLAAGPKAGKSMWTLQTVSHWVEATGGWCLHIDLENGRERYYRRLLQARSGVLDGDWEAARNKIENLTEVQRDAWTREEEWIEKGPGQRVLHQGDKPGMNQVEGWVLATKRAAKDRPLLVVVDSLQKIAFCRDDRRTGMDAWARYFENLRQRVNLCVLVVSELSRPAKGKAYAAELAGLKESGDLEYTADLVLGLSPLSSIKGASVMKCLANRDGEDGDVAHVAVVYPEVVETPLPNKKEKA